MLSSPLLSCPVDGVLRDDGDQGHELCSQQPHQGDPVPGEQCDTQAMQCRIVQCKSRAVKYRAILCSATSCAFARQAPPLTPSLHIFLYSSFLRVCITDDPCPFPASPPSPIFCLFFTFYRSLRLSHCVILPLMVMYLQSSIYHIPLPWIALSWDLYDIPFHPTPPHHI